MKKFNEFLQAVGFITCFLFGCFLMLTVIGAWVNDGRIDRLEKNLEEYKQLQITQSRIDYYARQSGTLSGTCHFNSDNSVSCK